MFNEKISVIDFFMEIQAVASEKGVNLTHSNKRVYLSLLDFADKFPQETIKTNKGIRFNSTTAKLAEFCSVSPRIVTESLSKLNKCGIIRYTTNKPHPSIIFLDKAFYKKFYKE